MNRTILDLTIHVSRAPVISLSRMLHAQQASIIKSRISKSILPVFYSSTSFFHSIISLTHFRDTLSPPILISTFANLTHPHKFFHKQYFISQKIAHYGLNQTIERCTFTRCFSRGSPALGKNSEYFESGGAISVTVNGPFLLTLNYVGFRECCAKKNGACLHSSEAELSTFGVAASRCEAAYGTTYSIHGPKNLNITLNSTIIKSPSATEEDSFGGIMIKGPHIRATCLNISRDTTEIPGVGLCVRNGAGVSLDYSIFNKINAKSINKFKLSPNPKPEVAKLSRSIFTGIRCDFLNSFNSNGLIESCYFQRVEGLLLQYNKCEISLLNCASNKQASDQLPETVPPFYLFIAISTGLTMPQPADIGKIWDYGIPRDPSKPFTASRTFDPTPHFTPSETLARMLRVDGKRWADYKKEANVTKKPMARAVIAQAVFVI